MSTLQELADLQKAVDKAYTNANTLDKGLTYLGLKLEFLEAVKKYRKKHKLTSPQGGPISQGNLHVLLPGVREVSQTQLNVWKVEDAMKGIRKQFGDSKDWKPRDFEYNSLVHTPTNVVKRGGRYDSHGDNVYFMFYVPTGKGTWIEDKPGVDEQGHYFTGHGSEKIYFYRYNPEEEPQAGPSAAPAPPPKKKQPKKASPKGSKTLLPRTGHGLKRLLAEARDPYTVEFSDPSLERIKGFRKRCLKKWPRLKATSTYSWHKGDHRCMFQWKTGKGRDLFFADCKFKKPHTWRLGNFETD
ncbi:E2 [Wesgulfec papillomavirus]|nr:E2 [Wesgulfec papillomavirus]